MAGKPEIKVSFVQGGAKYDTFEEAIAASDSDPRTQRALIDSKRLGGATVEGFRWSDEAVEWTLSSGEVLRLFMSKHVVDWELRNEHLLPAISSSPALVVEFPSGSKVPWNRLALLDSTLGRELKVSASDADVFMYFRGRPDGLVFGQLRAEPEGTPLLFFGDE